MKKFLLFVLPIIVTVVFVGNVFAGVQFPDKGWHKGPYLYATGGMMQASNDKNQDINQKFGSTFTPAVGLMFGWDILDWIGPQLQVSYGFDNDTVGNGAASHPVEKAGEHLINIALLGRVTFLTQWKNVSEKFKILPYVKLGAAAHGTYVSATSANKIGSWGYGPAVGAGLECLVKDHFGFGLDLQENLLFLQEYKKTVNGVPNTKIMKGGFYGQFNLMGFVGYHF